MLETLFHMRIIDFNVKDIKSTEIMSLTLKIIILNVKDVISVDLMLKLMSVMLFLRI